MLSRFIAFSWQQMIDAAAYRSVGEATYDLGHAAVKISLPVSVFLPSGFSGALALDAAKIAIFGC